MEKHTRALKDILCTDPSVSELPRHLGGNYPVCMLLRSRQGPLCSTHPTGIPSISVQGINKRCHARIPNAKVAGQLLLS